MKLKFKLFLDACMAVILFICMKYQFTGSLLHEILGVTLILGLFVHIALNFKYYVSAFRSIKMLTKKSGRYIFSFVLNILLFTSLVILLASSMVISKELLLFLNIQNSNYDIWRISHILSAVTLLVCAFLHLLLHFNMIKALIMKKITSKNFEKIYTIGTRVIALIMCILVLTSSIHATFSAFGIEGHRRNHLPDSSYIDARPTKKEDGSTNTTEDSATQIESPIDEDSTVQIESPIDEDSTAQIESPNDEGSPSEEDYLRNLFCNGCSRHCSLLSPRCNKGKKKAKEALEDFYSTEQSNF